MNIQSQSEHFTDREYSSWSGISLKFGSWILYQIENLKLKISLVYRNIHQKTNVIVQKWELFKKKTISLKDFLFKWVKIQ